MEFRCRLTSLKMSEREGAVDSPSSLCRIQENLTAAHMSEITDPREQILLSLIDESWKKPILQEYERRNWLRSQVDAYPETDIPINLFRLICSLLDGGYITVDSFLLDKINWEERHAFCFFSTDNEAYALLFSAKLTEKGTNYLCLYS